LTIYFSQGSAATDLRGGDSFNSGFLRNYDSTSFWLQFDSDTSIRRPTLLP